MKTRHLPNEMYKAHVRPIMAPNLQIAGITSHTRWPTMTQADVPGARESKWLRHPYLLRARKSGIGLV